MDIFFKCSTLFRCSKSQVVTILGGYGLSLPCGALALFLHIPFWVKIGRMFHVASFSHLRINCSLPGILKFYSSSNLKYFFPLVLNTLACHFSHLVLRLSWQNCVLLMEAALNFPLGVSWLKVNWRTWTVCLMLSSVAETESVACWPPDKSCCRCLPSSGATEPYFSSMTGYFLLGPISLNRWIFIWNCSLCKPSPMVLLD